MNGKRIFRIVLILAALCAGPAPLGADTSACPGTGVVTVDAGADAPAICDAVARIRGQLASCSLTAPETVAVAVVPDLGEACLGIYHCGEARIEILPPAAYAGMQGDGGAFEMIGPEALFESVLRHELAHAALDEMPCPFDSCVVAQEYIAYGMQIMFLPEADRAAFEAADTREGPVPRDMLNPMILMMAPDVFARRAWQHLTEQDDPCGFIDRVARGEILLDMAPP